jgi:hypothetical protein
MNQRPAVPLLAALVLGATAFAGDDDKKAVLPVPDDLWQFKLASPGWLAGLEGDIGIDGVISGVDVDPGTIIRHIDMAASLRGEASKGRFGVTGDFLYLSLSDGIGTKTVVKKLDLQVDEIIGELGVRWRLIDSPRGSLDVIGGVRYINLHQQLVVQANAERIDEASTRLVDAVGDGLRTALTSAGLRELIAAEVATSIEGFDPNRPSQLPIGPLGGRLGAQARERVQEILEARRAELTAAVQAVQQSAGAARVQAQARLNDLKKGIGRAVADAVEDRISTRVARTDDWFDPYVGLRARYHFNDRFYATAKGDVGGFGVGSDFAWQAEAALGCRLGERIFAEAGYRALGTDYDHDGLTYDVVTHGAQVTLGINF